MSPIIKRRTEKLYPCPVSQFKICSILVEEVDGQKCLAAIMQDQSKSGAETDWDWVLRNGVELNFGEALCYFPGLRKKNYVKIYR